MSKFTQALWLTTGILLSVTGCAELKEAGRTVGHATRDATTAIGHATRDTTKAIGHASRDAVNSVKDDLSGDSSD